MQSKLKVDSLLNIKKTPVFNTDSIGSQKNLADTSRTNAVPTAPSSGDINTTINYNAEDSIFFDLKTQNISMFGNTHIDYGEITLEAERTDVNWQKQTIKSAYVQDSTGRKIGKPVFKESTDVYETDNIIYNFKTRRAVIKGIVTEQDGAFMHGADVKKNEYDELFIRRARYTTCNLEDPHFFIESSKLKAIPGNKVITGPAVLKFRSTEGKSLFTPLALPFGVFPQPKSRVSGVIFPRYGEERRRGFFLREGGYYWAINDYVDLRVTADIYTRGGFGSQLTTNYKKRYKYNGTFSFAFNRNISDEGDVPLETNDTWVRWNHRPETRGNTSFTASVSAGTSTFNQNNNVVNQDFQRSINAQFSSNVSYQQRFKGASLSLSARQQQNVATGIMNLTFPEMTLTVNRINPFKNIIRDPKNPLAKLNFSHNFVSRVELTNGPQGSFPFNVVNTSESSQDTLNFFSELDRVFERGRIGGRHTIPVSTSFGLLKFFTVTPSFNYTELWYPQELQFEYDENLQGVRVDTVRGFSRAGSWRSSVAVNTVLYGTVFFKKGKIKAVRHVITPSLSFSYNPDFGDERFGVFSEVQVDSTGRTQRLSRFERFVFGSPPAGESQSLSLSIQNNLEIKVEDKNDTTGTGTKKIKIFDNFSVNSGYNFAADSFQLSNITWRARTSFFQGAISVALSGTIDPYIYELLSETVSATGARSVQQRRVNRFAWDAGQGIGQLTNLTTNISMNLSPNTFSSSSRGGGDPGKNANNQINQSFFDDPSVAEDFATPEEIDYIRNRPLDYVDFNLPWSLGVNYSITRSQRGFQDPTLNQTLSFRGSLALTPKTQITFNSGYDIENGEFTTTQISISRDLHCWNLSFNLVPFGRFQSFSLRISPKSSLLQQLKIERRRSFLDFFN